MAFVLMCYVILSVMLRRCRLTVISSSNGLPQQLPPTQHQSQHQSQHQTHHYPPVDGAATPYTEILGEQIALHVSTWDIDEMATLAHIARRYHIDIRLARYYLMREVRRGQLCRVKWGKRTYYMCADWREYMKYIGLRTL